MCANIRRVGERHKIVRQTDFVFGVDARADSGGPLRPDPPLPVRFSPHDLCHGWDLPWWLPAIICDFTELTITDKISDNFPLNRNILLLIKSYVITSLRFYII